MNWAVFELTCYCEKSFKIKIIFYEMEIIHCIDITTGKYPMKFFSIIGTVSYARKIDTTVNGK